MNAAASLIEYLQNLTITQGRLAGDKFTVLPWQRRFVRGAFQHGTHSAALSVARGNGKTALLSGIASATLNGPLAVSRGETVLVASSFEQARIAFEHVIAFMGTALSDKDKWKVWDTAQSARIENRFTGARVRCIGSDPRRAHGLAPVLVLADEPAQWPATTGERMVAALRTAAGKQPHSRFVALGTMPADSTHWFQKMFSDEAVYSQKHAAKESDPRFQKRIWAKANPSLAIMPDLEAAIFAESRQAKKDPALLASFESLRLNLGVPEIEASLLLSGGTWQKIEGLAPHTGLPVWGIDLGTSAAQSAVAAYWPATGALESFAAFPREPSLKERGLRDGCADLYEQCARRGELLQIGEHATDVGGLLIEALRRYGRPSKIVSDRWREAELREALQKHDLPVTQLELRGMGFKDGSEDVRSFRRAVVDGQVIAAASLLLRSAMCEARCVTDPAGNSKLSKGTQGGRRLRARDDSAAAAILAVSAGVRAPAQPAQTWQYRGMVG